MATKVQQERVNRWISKWKSKLLLDRWAIVVEYVAADPEYTRSDGTVAHAYAEISVDTRYREAALKIYPVLFRKPVGHQQATLLHEIIHIITNDVKTALDAAVRKGAISARNRDDVLEGITEDITKIILKPRMKAGSYNL